MSVESIRQFLYRKSLLCDQKKWDEYIELFDENSEFHIPQWESELEHTTDPKTQMSLLYYSDRSGLEDRVFRIRTDKSAACKPLPRTMHEITNVTAEQDEDGNYKVTNNWVTHYHRFEVSGYFYGRSEYTLKPVDDDWKILRKFSVLLNDKVNHVLDFYHV